MDWKTMLAYVTGSVDHELLRRNEYLVAENRILRTHIQGRVHLTDGEVAPAGVSEDVKAAIVLFAALCDERWRRLFAGVEALQLGRGAEGWIADLLGRGQGSARAARGRGAGRPHPQAGRGTAAGRKKTPAIVDEIRALMQPETAGDPMTGLKWTRKTTPKPYDSKALPWGAARSVACSHRWIFAGASITRSGRRRRPRIGTSSFA